MKTIFSHMRRKELKVKLNSQGMMILMKRNLSNLLFKDWYQFKHLKRKLEGKKFNLIINYEYYNFYTYFFFNQINKISPMKELLKKLKAHNQFFIFNISHLIDQM